MPPGRCGCPVGVTRPQPDAIQFQTDARESRSRLVAGTTEPMDRRHGTDTVRFAILGGRMMDATICRGAGLPSGGGAEAAGRVRS